MGAIIYSLLSSTILLDSLRIGLRLFSTSATVILLLPYSTIPKAVRIDISKPRLAAWRDSLSDYNHPIFIKNRIFTTHSDLPQSPSQMECFIPCKTASISREPYHWAAATKDCAREKCRKANEGMNLFESQGDLFACL